MKTPVHAGPLIERVSRLIRERRVSMDMPQGELAKLTGTTRQSINCYEKGRYLPQLTIMLRLASVLGIDLNDLHEPREI